MARAATTSDVYNAIAEPRRRQIIDLLAAGGGQPVNDLVLNLGLAQPAVSKHLGVLRKVGLVTVSRNGRERVYQLDARPLKPLCEWASTFERFWDEHLDAIQRQAERTARQQKTKP